MWGIHHELLCRNLVEVDVAFWRVVEPDDSYVYGLRDLIDVVENLSKERRRGELASDETTTLDNSWIRIAGLRKRFKPKDAD